MHCFSKLYHRAYYSVPYYSLEALSIKQNVLTDVKLIQTIMQLYYVQYAERLVDEITCKVPL